MACKRRLYRPPEDNCLDDTGSNGDAPSPDPFVGSDYVFGLNADNFKSFLKSKSIAMVMFYMTDQMASAWTRKHFKKAAEKTKRPGHAYAAVDCSKDIDFCVEEGIIGVPHFKVYSKGDDMGFDAVATKVTYQEMKAWVEGYPVAPS